MRASDIAANRHFQLRNTDLEKYLLNIDSRGREEAMALLETLIMNSPPSKKEVVGINDSSSDNSESFNSVEKEKLMLADTLASDRQVQSIKSVAGNGTSWISDSYREGRDKSLSLLGVAKVIEMIESESESTWGTKGAKSKDDHHDSNVSHHIRVEDVEWENLGISSLPHAHDTMQQNATLLERFLSKALYPKNGPCPERLSRQLRDEIKKYVGVVSEKYHAVNFHSFEHASHVMLSASKLVSMLPSSSSCNEEDCSSFSLSDPWLHFSICLASLLHDVDHQGVSNQQLSIEKNPISVKYCLREFMGSYAECNSIDVGMSLLEEGEFPMLRSMIKDNNCFNKIKEMILSTDISSKERRNVCQKRWETKSKSSSNTAHAVVDHIMQVADVSHTMQQFETFLEWNERLYLEMLVAWERRNDSNAPHPSENWYDSQIGFYDFYIIPLAERLDESGAFVKNTHFASNAKANRARWVKEGEVLTKEMLASAEIRNNTEDKVVPKAAAVSTCLLPSINKRDPDKIAPFPEQLHRMILGYEQEGWPDIIFFLPHGRAFVVGNVVRLISEALPKYFSQSRRCFFERQLSAFGFTEITNGPDKGAYYHELFRKDRPDLARQIRRRKVG